MKKSARIILLALLMLLFAASAAAQGEIFPLSESGYTMSPNAQFKLSAPDDRTIDKWSSSNEQVATVDENGLVTTYANGIAIIKAETSSLDSGTCAIYVRTIAASSISLSSKNLIVDPRRTATLSVQILPFNSSFTTVEWTSSNPSVAVVENGVVKPRQTGSALITAQLVGTKYKATCKVTVKNLSVKQVLVTPSKASVVVGNDIALTATLKPVFAGESDQPFTWESADTSIATVDENGLVACVSPGIVKIKAFNSGSGKAGYATITVKELGVESVSFVNGDDKTYIDVGETLDLSGRVVILPSNAKDTPVSWTSTNNAVATVDENGVVTGVKTGQTNIKATAGGKTGSVEVRVRGGKVCEVTLSAGGDVILGGDYQDIPAQPYYPLSGEAEFDRLISTYGADYPFKNLEKIFKNDDITVINLEGVLTNANTRKAKRPHYLRSRPEYAQSILKNSGIDVCCLANNHSLDYSFTGYKATKRALDAAGIKSMGHFEGEDCVIKVEKNGVAVKIGFCGMQMPVSRETMRMEIAALRRSCDIVVASFHWANSRQWYANVDSYMRANARAAIKFGADLVLGHHRHVPSGIERYGDKLIVYDLANLVTGLKHVGSDDSMIFQITWKVDETGYIEEAGYKVIPVKTTVSTDAYPFSDNEFGKMGMPVNKWQPDIVTGSEGRRIIDAINANSLKIKVPYYNG